MVIQILTSMIEINDMSIERIMSQGINRKVPPTQIFFQMVTETDFWFTRFGIIAFAPKCRNLDNICLIMQPYSTKALTYEDNSARMCGRDNALDFIGTSISRQISISRFSPV